MHEIYFFIFELVLVFVVLLALLQYINNVATDLGFEKRFASIDISLMTSALFYTPGIIKQEYETPVTFWQKDRFVPVEAQFAKSEVAIKEIGKELMTNYWYLSDLTMDEFLEQTRLEGIEIKATGEIIGVRGPRTITFYKAGRNIFFNERNTNAYQLVCPVVNTSAENWQSKKTFIAKVATRSDDLGVRITNTLTSQYPSFTTTASATGSTSGVKVSAIPGDSDTVIAIGDSGEKGEPGALVIYVPIDSALLKSRKLACLIINHLLNPESAVLYAQIMPINLEKIKTGSPLSVFKEKAKEDQAIVFIDINRFAAEQVEVRNFAQAVKEAVEHYYGKRTRQPVSQTTVSVSYRLLQASRASSGAGGAQFASFSPSNIKPFGPVVNNVKVNTDWGETVLNPGMICDPARCDNVLYKPFSEGAGDNPRKILVIHTTVGGLRRTSTDYFINRYKCRCLHKKDFCNEDGRKYIESGKKACYSLTTHYVLGRDGKYDYVAPEDKRTAHAPGTHKGMRINSNSIGIETANAETKCKDICKGKHCPASSCKTLTAEQVATLTDKEKGFWGPGYFSGKWLATRTYEEVQPTQMLALLTLSAEIMIRYRISLEDVIRHIDASLSLNPIPENAHGDPGPLFPWRKFQANLQKIIEQYNSAAQASGNLVEGGGTAPGTAPTTAGATTVASTGTAGSGTSKTVAATTTPELEIPEVSGRIGGADTTS